MSGPLRVDPTRGFVRGVRAAVLAVPTVGGAVLAHATAGGCADALAIVAAAGLCWPAAVALLRARRSLSALVVWVVLAQLLTHVLLEWLCGAATGTRGLAHHLLMSVDGTMVLTHVVAVVATSLLLGRADAGLWTADALLRAASRALRLPLLAPVIPVAVPHLVFAVDVSPLRALWETAPLQRRGPPVCALAERPTRSCRAQRLPRLPAGHPLLELPCAPSVLLPSS